MVEIIKKFNMVVIDLFEQIEVKDNIIDNLEVEKEILMNRVEKHTFWIGGFLASL